MRPNRHDPIAAPISPDLDTPTVTRRAAAQLARDLAASVGHQDWSAIPDDIREVMRDAMVSQLEHRLAHARSRARYYAGAGSIPAAASERVVRLERALDAARRLA